MSHLASIAFACSISLFSTASFAQQPSNDGRCDVLSDATPSLYGLCIAYWATQENGNSDASSKILAKYNDRKSDGIDPDMPGLVACLCWNADELVSWEDAAKESGQTVTCSIETDQDGVGETFYWLADGGANGSLQVHRGTYLSCYAPIPPADVHREFDLNQFEVETCWKEAEENLCSAGS